MSVVNAEGMERPQVNFPGSFMGSLMLSYVTSKCLNESWCICKILLFY